jgi:hypothetical protein
MHSYNFKSLNSSKYIDLNILITYLIISFTAATLFENNYVQGSDDEPAYQDHYYSYFDSSILLFKISK